MNRFNDMVEPRSNLHDVIERNVRLLHSLAWLAYNKEEPGTPNAKLYASLCAALGEHGTELRRMKGCPVEVSQNHYSE